MWYFHFATEYSATKWKFHKFLGDISRIHIYGRRGQWRFSGILTNSAAIRQSMLCKPKRRNSYTHASKAIDIREEILDLITSTSRSAREAELRPRIAKHLSGRVRPPAGSQVAKYWRPVVARKWNLVATIQKAEQTQPRLLRLNV